MKKIILSVLAILALVITPSFAKEDIRVILNGEELSFVQPPVIVNDTTLVPMRAIFEALGAKVDWDGNTRWAAAYSKGVLVELYIDDTTMRHNTIEIPIYTPPQIINDSTMIPLRVVSECFGMQVDWDADTRIITINDLDKFHILDWNDKYKYYGEVENGYAVGFGELYDIETGRCFALGKFDNDAILEGTCFFDSGSRLYCTYSNGKKNGKGTYITYDGERAIYNYVDDSREGIAYVYWSDGSYEVNTYINDKIEGIAYRYNPDDTFCCYALYIDDELIKKSNSKEELEALQKQMYADSRLAELSNQLIDLEQEQNKEIEKVREWYLAENEKLREFSTSNPYETDWAKAIYKQYGIDMDGSSEDDDDIDSFAAANAKRQQISYINSANDVILETFNAKITAMSESIESEHNSKLTAIQDKYNTLYTAIQEEIKKLGNNANVSNVYSDNTTNTFNKITASPLENVENYLLPLHLFSNDGKIYLGKVVSDTRDKESIMNEFGEYGSKFRQTSIWNEFSPYGRGYGDESIYNENASKPPIIVDSNGTFIAYLTSNTKLEPAVQLFQLQMFIKKYNQ